MATEILYQSPPINVDELKDKKKKKKVIDPRDKKFKMDKAGNMTLQKDFEDLPFEEK